MDDVNYIYAHKACDSVGSTAVSTGETPIMTLPTTSPANRLPAAGTVHVYNAVSHEAVRFDRRSIVAVTLKQSSICKV